MGKSHLKSRRVWLDPSVVWLDPSVVWLDPSVVWLDPIRVWLDLAQSRPFCLHGSIF